MTESLDVAIIGAGAAGLEAARLLRRASLRIAVLEARDRVGGRIHTLREPSWPVAIDLGAEFVHGRPPILLDRLRAAGVAVTKLEPGHHLFRAGRLGPATPEWTRALALASELASPSGAVAEDMTVAQRLASRPWSRRGSAVVRRFARDYLEGFNAADLRRASVRALGEQQRAADDISGDALGRPKNGYRSMVLHLARAAAAPVRGIAPDPERLPVLRLGTIVDRVVWRRGRVRLEAHASDGVRLSPIFARTVIVSVSLGVLQARPDAEGAIRFLPALPPAVRAAIGALAMGAVTKVVLRFNRIPWRGLGPRGLGFLHVPGDLFPTFWTLAEGPRPVVVAWAAGPAADRLRNLSPEALRQAALRTLARAFRRDLRELETFVDGASVADWGADPFARGAYSWVPVGALGASATLAEPIEDTLILAGEATETSGHAGTVHGALMTGERAARDARAALRRQ
jgi:hypothetical protein